MRGLTNCQDDDIIIISDLDEIVRASSVDTIAQALTTGRQRYVHCEQSFYTFFLNVQHRTVWIGSTASTFKFLKTRSPQLLRDYQTTANQTKRAGPLASIIRNSGWHFSWMGGVDRCITKLAAFSHKELDTPENRALQGSKRLIANDCDIVEVDESYPRYVVDNLSKFKAIGFIFSNEFLN